MPLVWLEAILTSCALPEVCKAAVAPPTGSAEDEITTLGPEAAEDPAKGCKLPLLSTNPTSVALVGATPPVGPTDAFDPDPPPDAPAIPENDAYPLPIFNHQTFAAGTTVKDPEPVLAVY